MEWFICHLIFIMDKSIYSVNTSIGLTSRQYLNAQWAKLCDRQMFQPVRTISSTLLMVPPYIYILRHNILQLTCFLPVLRTPQATNETIVAVTWTDIHLDG